MIRLILALAVVGVALAAGVLRAQTPRTISFQGLLADAQGRPVADGQHLVTVRIYEGALGGAPVFEEASNAIVEGGVFSTVIGATGGGIPSSLSFDRQYFVGISIDGGVELLPRIAMTAVPYAFHAVTADTAARALFALDAAHAATSDVSARATLADRASIADSSARSGAAALADRALVADEASSLASNATGVVRSINGRAGALRVVGENGATVTTAGDTVKLRVLPIAAVHRATASAIEIIDSASFSSSGSGALLRLDLRDTTANRIGFRLSTAAHGMPAMEVSASGGGSAATFTKNRDRATGTGGTFIGPVIAATAAPGSQVTAAQFSALDTNNNRPAVDIEHRGRGVGLQVDAAGANIATFRRRRATGGGGASTSTVVRFDSTGKGFFDGGTQTGGADIAEAFDVDGERASYTPGDVLVISTARERQVTLSREPYSMLVSGVYATKPGVLLTEEMNDTSIEEKVPMGVIGVIPTKVTSENGPIAIGDLLVTSSTPGHAMKADIAIARDRPGCIIGKALQAYDGEGAGVTLVLVNVR